MHKIDHKLLPAIFCDMFTYNIEVHRHYTRSRNQFRVPIMRLTLCQNTLKYKGVKIWNHFIHLLENTPIIHKFKKNVKEYLNNNNLTFDL
jgi:hypothetical protein